MRELLERTIGKLKAKYHSWFYQTHWPIYDTPLAIYFRYPDGTNLNDRLTKEATKTKETKHILDAGMGRGVQWTPFLKQHPHFKLTCTSLEEPDAELLKLPNFKFHKITADQIAHLPDTFDFIVSHQ